MRLPVQIASKKGFPAKCLIPAKMPQVARSSATISLSMTNSLESNNKQFFNKTIFQQEYTVVSLAQSHHLIQLLIMITTKNLNALYQK